MRFCPVCNSKERELLWRADFVVPDGWPRPKYLDWLRCECGMIYADHPTVTQFDYDRYYQEFYGYGVEDYEQQKRLRDRAHYVAEKFDKSAKVADFGGGYQGLTRILAQYGFNNTSNVEAGDEIPENVDVIIAEMVIEHVYSMNSVMEEITTCLKDGGTLIVDVPDAGAIAMNGSDKMPLLDFQQVHLNHFRVVDMLRLMERWGMELVETCAYVERNLNCRMFVFVKGADIGKLSREHVTKNMDDKIKKIEAIGDKPVIVWGLGDIALHLLARHPLNVKYYVCNDPAFKDQTIGRIPVLEAPISDHPIVVMAQAQKDKLIEHIKSVCDNEIIEI
jgi:SAM-dependent methyltransferase